MKRSYQKSRRHQLDEKLNNFSGLGLVLGVGTGWVRTVREALGMTTTQLAKRVGTNQSNIVRIEQREQEGTVSVNSLKKLAEALQCDLAYVLVPRKPLDQIVRNQALKVAKNELARISRTMSLEGQKTKTRSQEEWVKDLVDELVRNTPSKLWDEEK